MSRFEQPPNPLAYGSEALEAPGLAHHNEFIETQQGSACRHIDERLTAYALLGASCAITALSVYSKLQSGDFLPITGFVPLMAFASRSIFELLEELEAKHNPKT